MKFIIDTAKPIKAPLIIRFGVTMYDNDDNLMGEYEIALDIEEDIAYQIEDDGRTNVNVNAVAIQQKITSQIAELQIASVISRGFEGLEWIANEEEEENGEDENESTANTGDTIKLSPVLPESN